MVVPNYHHHNLKMMLLPVLCLWPIISSLFVYVSGGKLPEPEVKIEVVHKPFICFRKSKYGDMLLVHFEGFLASNGTMFHSR